MSQANYLQRLAAETPTQFWHDSGEPAEIERALSNSASGVTTNPILITRHVLAHADEWRETIRHMGRFMSPLRIPHAVTAQVVSRAADMLLPRYVNSKGATGHVCAQGNPNNHMKPESMVEEALDFDRLRPNIACKIPVSAEGLLAIEELASRGITTTCTTSFTVPQALAIAEAFRRGLRKRPPSVAERPVHCYAVIMAGRLDDHVRDEVQAGRGRAGEAAITTAGLAVTRRAYRLFAERSYESVVLIGGMRGHYHVTGLLGGAMTLTISPAMQAELIEQNPPLTPASISDVVDQTRLEELANVPDFRRAYEPDGMKPAEFSSFGAFLKTQGQFIENYQKLWEFVQQSLA